MGNGRFGIDRFHLVAYERNTTFGVNHDIHGQIVNANGTLGSTSVLANITANVFEPQLAHRTADQMVLAFWLEQGGVDPGFDFGVQAQEIDVSPLGVVNVPFTISMGVDIRERSPGVTCASSTTCQVAYRRYDESLGCGTGGMSGCGADRVRRVFADDVLQCPCGGRRSVIAVGPMSQ